MYSIICQYQVFLMLFLVFRSEKENKNPHRSFENDGDRNVSGIKGSRASLGVPKGGRDQYFIQEARPTTPPVYPGSI
jgi:hypothetical protein